MEVDFCIEALKIALERGTPGIFNSDQGSQFTSIAFTSILKGSGIDISMDGKGRYADNIFVERLWRSLKYEEVYPREYETGQEAHEGISKYICYYNDKRQHQALAYRTPSEVYHAGRHAARKLSPHGGIALVPKPDRTGVRT